MLLILLTAAAAQTLDPGMVRTPDAPARCNPALARTVTLTPAEARKLAELPRGVVQLAVYKTVAGCSVTVLPQRDEHGQHLMLQSDRERLLRTHRRRPAPPSALQRRP